MPTLSRTHLLSALFILSLPRLALAQGSPASAPPPEPTTARPEGPAATPAPAPVEAKPDDLDQRVRVLERRWEVEQEVLAEKKAEERKNPPGVAVANPKDGVGIKSADGKFSFRFRPILQADGRFFIDTGLNTFLLRRVRPAIEGTAFEFFDWLITPELAGTPNVQDAYVNIRFVKEIQLRGGKFKPPVGIERLTLDRDLPFAERGLPTNLVPDRDVGVQLHGDLFDGTILWAGGIFNGVGDGVNGDVDNNDKKDLAGRIFVRPFAPLSFAPLDKLSLGVAATRGTQTGPLPAFKSASQQSFFSYPAAVLASGTHRRIAPQLSYYWGPFGLIAEYTRASQIVTNGSANQLLNNDAWQVSASVFVTGEDASYTTVTPKNQLDPQHGTIGAIEIAARIGQLRIDSDTFALKFADRTVTPEKATEWGLGLNWHLARSFKLMADYDRTNFEGGAKTGDRPAEIVILTRLQAAY